MLIKGKAFSSGRRVPLKNGLFCMLLQWREDIITERIEMHQSEIDNLKGVFPERSSEFVTSVILFSDWFIV